jgi:hypothetical protein
MRVAAHEPALSAVEEHADEHNLRHCHPDCAKDLFLLFTGTHGLRVAHSSSGFLLDEWGAG